MSKKSLYVFFVLLLVVPLALAACGGEKEAEDLSETFDSATGLSLKYPKGWVVKDSDGGIAIANSEEMAARLESESAEGVPKDGFGLMILDPALATMFSAGQSPKEFAAQFASDFADENTTVGEAEDVKVGDNAGVKVSIKSSKEKSEGYLLVWESGDTTYIAIAIAYEGKLGDYEATAQKIMESITTN